MCQVQRVLNTCGHINDHVLLTCHLARRALPQPEPSQSASSSAYSSSQRRRQQQTSQDQQQHQRQDPEQEQQQGQGQEQRETFTLSITDIEMAIAKTGFQACSQPYCIFARVWELESPAGFKCMVEGCGRAD